MGDVDLRRDLQAVIQAVRGISGELCKALRREKEMGKVLVALANMLNGVADKLVELDGRLARVEMGRAGKFEPGYMM